MNRTSSLTLTLFSLLLAGSVAAQQPEGFRLFRDNCAQCHGPDGTGAELGPSIIERVREEEPEALISFLRSGSPERGMPPVMLSDEQMPVLVQTLQGLTRRGGMNFQRNSPLQLQVDLPEPTIGDYVPVTDEILNNPDPGDWLWFSRTADAQRFSPLDQINRDNVGGLALAWTRNMPEGVTETIPTVYNGIMYVTLPGGNVAAYRADSGDLVWQTDFFYSRNAGASGRSKNMGIYADMIYFTAPDSTIVALDVHTGQERWRADAGNRQHNSGALIAEGRVFSAGSCNRRDDCFISAHDAFTGELLWKFYTAAAPDPVTGEDSWNGLALEDRRASPWGLTGSYDFENGLLYWGIANPTPNRRADRHGSADGTGWEAPADLYSNSTVAIDPASGELVWYYQHLPGDDWDLDMNEERTLMTVAVNPDPEHVKWINPAITPGEERDVIVNVGEGGGMWMLDRITGEFLWAKPFPEDTEHFFLKDIDVTTGRTILNDAAVLRNPGDNALVCYYNTRSFWPTSYDPERQMLYVPYIKNCLDMTAASDSGSENRVGAPLPGTPVEELNGIARVNMVTGETTFWPTGPVPTNSASLSTAGDLVFHGDLNRRFRAMDADTGEVLWQTTLSAPVVTSNITFEVDGRQYVAVLTGRSLSQGGITSGSNGPARINIEDGTGNSIYVFALPQE